MLRLDVAQRLADAIDRPGGDSRGLELIQPFCRRLLGNGLADQPNHFPAIGDPDAVRLEALVRSPLGMTAHFRKPGELPLVSNRNDDRLVGRFKWLVWNDVG